MGTIQNHSRDWVTVKLKFEVPPDQDLEKVRKLIKKVGQELLEDPDIEGQFLAAFVVLEPRMMVIGPCIGVIVGARQLGLVVIDGEPPG